MNKILHGIGIHDWTPFGEIEQEKEIIYSMPILCVPPGGIPSSHLVQYRKCKICNKIERIELD